jgi:hypothetical protein
LIGHIKTDHKDWEDVMKAKDKKVPSAFVNRKGANIFNWLEWIVIRPTEKINVLTFIVNTI